MDANAATFKHEVQYPKLDKYFTKLDETTENMGKYLASLALVIQEQNQQINGHSSQVVFSYIIWPVSSLHIIFYVMFPENKALSKALLWHAATLYTQIFE